MERRLTAQLVLSERDIVLAYSCRRVNLGPNGEWYIARLLRTENGGELWADVPLVRGFIDRIVHGGFPVWPPESVSEVVSHGSSFDIVFRDEWVPFEPGGESLWRARRTPSGRWRTERVRTMRYETDDSPMPIPEIPLVLPSGICAPPEDLLDPWMVQVLARRLRQALVGLHFYSSVGYVALEVFPNLWGPRLPVLRLVKALR